jgi:hypothetical protein
MDAKKENTKKTLLKHVSKRLDKMCEGGETNDNICVM